MQLPGPTSYQPFEIEPRINTTKQHRLPDHIESLFIIWYRENTVFRDVHLHCPCMLTQKNLSSFRCVIKYACSGLQASQLIIEISLS